MTREHAKELLPLITAFAEGVNIQFLNQDGEWADIDKPYWTSPASTYRIKPEPKTVLMTADDLTEGLIWLKKAARVELVTVFWDDGRLETELDGCESIEGLHGRKTLWSTDRKNWKPFTKEVEA